MDLYINLLEQNWLMSEIDNLDLLRFIEIRKRILVKNRPEEKLVTVDEIRW